MNPVPAASTSNPWALAALVAGNLLPLVGVLLWNWQVFDLLLLYWIESGVVGLFTVAKILSSRVDGASFAESTMAKLFTAPFFVLHYGIFWLVHGLFVYVLFTGVFGVGGPGTGLRNLPFSPESFLFGAVSATLARADIYAWPVLGLLVSHGVSFVTNYLGQGEYRRLSPNALMQQPYGRVFLLHLVIVLGGVATAFLGQGQVMLLLFVAFKVVVDLRAHLREHRAPVRG